MPLDVGQQPLQRGPLHGAAGILAVLHHAHRPRRRRWPQLALTRVIYHKQLQSFPFGKPQETSRGGRAPCSNLRSESSKNVQQSVQHFDQQVRLMSLQVL